MTSTLFKQQTKCLPAGKNSCLEVGLTVSLAVILFAAGVLYCLYYGRIGYMPQDSPSVFDGGWRILTGQIPFRDFTLSNAIIPIFLQAFFFKIFGVNWFVYCLHAAIFNGLFCVLVFFFLRMFGGTLPLASFYALLSGVIFYTPFGIAVQDQHAYFFTFLLVFLTCLSGHVSRSSQKQLILFFLPVVAVAAFLSKQIPTTFGIALAGIILLYAHQRNLFVLTRSLTAGTLFAGILLWILYGALGIDLELLKIYFFQLPSETGGERISWILSGRITLAIGYMLNQWRLFFPFFLVTIIIIATLPFILRQIETSQANTPWKALGQRIEKHFFPLLLAWLLLLVCFLFVIMTNNQGENGVPLIFISLGLTHIFLLNVFRHDGNARSHIPSWRQRPVVILISFILCGSALWCAWNFDRQVNATRMVHDLVYTTEDSKVPQQKMPDALSFLIWKTPASYSGQPKDFVRLIDFFQNHEGNFYLLGDSSILYALTGRPSVNPVLWFHPGQTMPHPGSPYFPAFQNRLMAALKKYHVRYIVLEESWSQIKLTYFPALDELVMEEGSQRERFGPFTIIELTRHSDKVTVRNSK